MSTIMNDVSFYRYVKSVERLGIRKHDAKEIVETAIRASKGHNVEMYIRYAITLRYGFTPVNNKITV
jgi:hypothetical protein